MGILDVRPKFLDPDEWLHLARACPVGQARRVYHGAEGRPNMVVKNDPDGWRAYCHRCHRSGFVRKELVKLEAPQLLKREREPTTPGKMYSVHEILDGSLGFPRDLAVQLITHWQSKGVSLPVVDSGFPHWAPDAHRIIYQTPEGLLGRDLTGKSPAKWKNYNPEQRFARGAPKPIDGAMVALTEDWYSACKISCYTPWLGIAMLGTELHADLAVRLCSAERVAICTDGDKAGDEAIPRIRSTLDLLAIPHKNAQPPAGYDPKDLKPEELLRLLS